MNLLAQMDEPQALVLLSGQLIECNEAFAYICGFSEKLASSVNLTTISKFNNPNEMLESLYLISILDSSQHWKATLGQQIPALSHMEFEIVVRLSDKTVDGEAILIASIKETEYSEHRKSRTSSFCSSSSHSDSFYFNTSSSKSDFGSVSEKSMASKMSHQNLMNILVVDDSVTSLKMMSTTLQYTGVRLSTCVT